MIMRNEWYNHFDCLSLLMLLRKDCLSEFLDYFSRKEAFNVRCSFLPAQMAYPSNPGLVVLDIFCTIHTEEVPTHPYCIQWSNQADLTLRWLWCWGRSSCRLSWLKQNLSVTLVLIQIHSQLCIIVLILRIHSKLCQPSI